MPRIPGPLGATEFGEDWIDPGTLSLGRSSAPMAVGGSELTPEERDRLLDLTQMVLDLAGFVDPTPISDGTSAAISVSRGDWFGAGLSGLALIPYVGDLAKIGKLGRWAQAVHKAVALARRNARFAERVRPLLRQISNVLDQIPVSVLPDSARSAVARMKDELASVVGVRKKVPKAALIDRYLRHWYRYIDELQLPAPPRDGGALWSKLDHIRTGKKGAEIAGQLAARDHKVTLEMTLHASKFAERYQLALAQLAEQLGVKADDLWDAFGKKIWSRVSLKYVSTLSGRVSAYVRLGGEAGVQAAVSAGREPILVDELWELSEVIASNARITSVELVDVVSGARKLMSREDVLRATRLSH